ncbi:MAG: sugar ABC transporter permease [Clostridia bacterium]|nr:sugar ABC transporter permease [Clostridia bacterium]
MNKPAATTAEKAVVKKAPKKQRFKFQTTQKINGYIFLIPWIIGFLLFFLMPMVNTIIYSFHEVGVKDTGGMEMTWVGIDNYISLFNEQLSTNSQQFTRVFADENAGIIMNTPLIVIFSLFAALLVNANYKGRDVVRVIFFLPIVLGLSIVTSMVTTTGGDVTSVTTSVSEESSFIMKLLTSYTFLPKDIISFVMEVVSDISSVISKAGVQTLLYLAALQSISPALYEVAKIEGATQYEVFWKVTFPMVSSITIFNFVYTFVDLFLDSSIAEEVYAFAFTKNLIGVGSALSVVYLVDVLVILLLILLILTKVVKLDA